MAGKIMTEEQKVQADLEGAERVLETLGLIQKAIDATRAIEEKLMGEGFFEREELYEMAPQLKRALDELRTFHRVEYEYLCDLLVDAGEAEDRERHLELCRKKNSIDSGKYNKFPWSE